MPFPISRGLDCPKYDKLISRKNAKSPVWNHFGLPATEAGNLVAENLAICQHCKFPVSSKGGSTSNLIAHLKNYHPQEYTTIQSHRCPSSSSSSASSVVCPLPSSSSYLTPSSSLEIDTEAENAAVPIDEVPPAKRQKTMLEFTPQTTTSEKLCTASVTKFIATSMQPYNIVECAPFLEMVKTLNPRYRLPGRKFFSKIAVPKLYNDTKEKIKKEIALVKDESVSITTDCWTALNSTPYMGITAHFIDSMWQLKSVCLCCVHFENDHTAENISETLSEKLSEWNLNINLLCSCTTDNGANILKAVSSFTIQHLPCFGHTINIGISKALQINILRKAVVKVKKLQSAISHSWKMSRDLINAQEMLQMKVMKLPSACPTRWSSTFKLCVRFLENQIPICKVLQDYPTKNFLALEKNEINALQDFVETTKLMEDITKNLSGDKYTTASSILPLMKKIKKNLQAKDGDSHLVKEIKKEIFSPLQQRYLDRNELMHFLIVSTICDPRFRLNFMEEKNENKKLILAQMQNVYDRNIVSNTTLTTKKEKHGLEKLLDSDEDEDPEHEDDAMKKAEKELANYLAMPKVALNDDPLNWWRKHESSFPSIKILAKKYLAVQGTSVPSERIFSAGGSIICKNRSSLLPKNAEMQVFLTLNRSYV